MATLGIGSQTPRVVRGKRGTPGASAQLLTRRYRWCPGRLRGSSARLYHIRFIVNAFGLEPHDHGDARRRPFDLPAGRGDSAREKVRQYVIVGVP